MQSMFEVPDDPIAHFQAAPFEGGIKRYIEGNHLSNMHIVANLPTYASLWMQNADALFDNLVLPYKILVEIALPFIRLAEVIWGRGYY